MDLKLRCTVHRLCDAVGEIQERMDALEANVGINKTQCRLRLAEANTSITNALQAVSDLVNAHDDHLMKPTTPPILGSAENERMGDPLGIKPQITDAEVKRAYAVYNEHNMIRKHLRIVLQDFLDRRG